jgi:hypothetical protein
MMMKKQIIFSLLLISGLVSCRQEPEEQVREGHTHHHTEELSEEDLSSTKSIKREAHGQVGDNHITVHYFSPGVRGRVIWGGLVAYDQVWVTGAHQATNIEFTAPIQVEGKTVPAGKDAFFTIPGQETWTIVLNRNWDQHLADDYNEADDVLRVQVTPEETETKERLEYSIEETDGGEGKIHMNWENLRVTLEFETQQ